jgi:AhpD family alkylhydroperoxidase
VAGLQTGAFEFVLAVVASGLQPGSFFCFVDFLLPRISFFPSTTVEFLFRQLENGFAQPNTTERTIPPMEPRIAYNKYSPNALHAMYGLEKHLKSSSIEEKLLHLIKLRASQINGCAYCIDMHSKDARANGDTEQRLYALNAWRETPFFTPRERSALAWTEALTLISQNHAPDELYDSTRKEFSEQELVDLTYAIGTINAWNRLAIAMRAVPGEYQPAERKAAAS